MKILLIRVLSVLTLMGMITTQVSVHADEDAEISEDAEAGFDNELSKEWIKKGHALDGVVEGSKEKAEQKNRQFRLNADNATAGDAASAGSRGEILAEGAREYGGQEAQRIKADTARTISSVDEADSWKNTMMDALESSITTGFVRFGETLGEEAAVEAVGAPRHRHDHDHDH